MAGRTEENSGGIPSDPLAAVAQILTPNGAVAGAGFLVTESVVVTCAHVVEAAGVGPRETIRLVFPHADGARRVEGHISGELWRAAENDDVAFIRLTDTPSGAQPVPLGSAEGSQGHRVRSFGFPAQAPREGHFGYGVAGDLLPGSDGRGELLQLTGANDLTTGFSGGPVLDNVTGLVIGMLTEITAPDEFERGLGIAYVTPTQVLRGILPELAEREVCPYRGLEPFTADHARWFQGRQEAVRQVLANLSRQRRLTLLLGPSGSGKSSLIQAGVLRELAEGELPGSDRWLAVLARPRKDLTAELERAGLAGARSGGIAAAVSRRLAEEPAHPRILLIIDQFEELFTQAVNGHRGNSPAVADQIAEAVDSQPQLSVILVMRDDFYPQLAALAPRLLEAATPGLLNVPGALNQRDLHDIITLPARDVGLHFQPGLPEQIITDVLATTPEEAFARQAPVTVLPLLELTLNQLWHGRRDGYLTHEAYRRIGAVSGSLTTWCDSALNELSPDQQLVARRILTSLVHPADRSRRIPAVRAQVPLGELRDLAAGPDEAPDGEVDTVMAALTRHRIVTTQTLRDSQHPEAAPGEPVAELIHDALIRDWGTLRDWVRQDHRFQEWLDRTRERQARWAQKNDPGDLLGGTALAEGLEWSHKRRLPGDIAAFLNASKDRQRAAVRRSRRLNTILAGLLALALLAAGGALWQWRTAVTAREAALSRQLAAQSSELIRTNPELASLLAVRAYRTNHNAESLEALQNAAGLPKHRHLSGHTDSVRSVVFSPDGGTLATVGDDRTLRLWSVAKGTALARQDEHTDEVYAVAFSPDGRTLATGGADATVRLRNAADGEVRTIIDEPTSAVVSVAFSPDGRTLATGNGDATIQLWDVATGALRRSLNGHTDYVTSLAFTPDGRTLASASVDTDVLLWDTSLGKVRRKLTGHEGEVNGVAFSPNGRSLATVGGDGTVQLWNPTTGEGRTYEGEGTLTSVAFSPDGRTLATGSDNVVQLWDVATGVPLRGLIGHTNSVYTVAFSPDGRTLASGGRDRTVRLWDMTTGAARANLVGHTNGVTSVAFSPDGDTLATASLDATARLSAVTGGAAQPPLAAGSDSLFAVAISPDGGTVATGDGGGTVRLWDAATGENHTTWTEHDAQVNSMAFSPDGRTLATASADFTVRLWDLPSGKTRTILKDHADAVNSVAFSRDGRTLATGSGDTTVGLWDAATGANRKFLKGHTNEVHSVAFSPDGRTVASASDDRTIRLWDIASSATRTTLIGHTDEVTSVAFSPDGRTLASGSADMTARLWNAASGKRLITLTGHLNSVFALAFSPDGRTLATGGLDSTTRLWNTALPRPDEAQTGICRAVGRDLTPQERTAYLPGRSADRVCPSG